MDNVSRTIELTLDQIMNRLQDIEARITQSSISLEQNLAKMAEHVQVMTAAVETSGEKFQAAATEAAEAWGSHVETAGQGFSQRVDQTGEALLHRLWTASDRVPTLDEGLCTICRRCRAFPRLAFDCNSGAEGPSRPVL